MENKKNLQVNCAMCDVRKITEEALSAYDEVQINTAGIVTTPEAQTLLSKHAVQLNCANVVSIDGDVRFSISNGSVSIKPGQAMPEEKVFLMVNGVLEIAPGSEEVLRHYAGMMVNGSISCPESMAGLLGSFTINGSVNAYPDGSIVLKKVAELDRVFHLRARQDAHYYAAKKIVALAPGIDFGKLAEKNVRFTTKSLLVSESQVEAAVPLFDERTDIVILPDGCAYANDDVELDETQFKRLGGKLYIDGDLTITPDSANVLDQISFLRVNGDLLVCGSLKDRVLALDAQYDRLRVVGGVLFKGRTALELSAAMLEAAEDGVSVADCVSVTIAEDVTPELLREKLVSLSDCICVTCTPEQRPAIEALAEDVTQIRLTGEEDEEETEEDKNTVQINTAYYTF